MKMKKIIACILALGLLGSCKKEETLTMEQELSLSISKDPSTMLVYTKSDNILIEKTFLRDVIHFSTYPRNTLVDHGVSTAETMRVICPQNGSCEFYTNGQVYYTSAIISSRQIKNTNGFIRIVEPIDEYH